MRDNVQGGALTETTLLVLLAFYKPNHGYGVMQFIKDKTNGRVDLGAGTLYGALNNLLKKGWIIQLSEEERKKEYIITDIGKEQVENEIKRLESIYNLARETVKGGIRGDEESF